LRQGGARKRHKIFEIARRWNREHRERGYEPFRVSVVDAWMMTDNRPETTSDGRHWVPEGGNPWPQRPRIGEAEGISICILADLDSVLDIIWDEFINERVTV
jgi:hypothetical protein